ncbi:MAG TPA: CAP domain-containing protein [Holophagaceae bacterium]
MRRFLPLFAVLALQASAPRPEPATAFERAVVQEMSDVRVSPRAYAEHLKALREYFHGTLWRLPGKVPLRTAEGVAALDEAIRFLESVRPVGPLRFNEGLARAARGHARYLGQYGLLSHRSADGSGPAGRLDRMGRWQSLVAENISTGEDDPRMVVIQLLVDDGVPERGHRRNLFNPELHQAGAGQAPHLEYGTVCVIDYADGFVEGR